MSSDTINMSLAKFRQFESLAEQVEKLAAKQIKREADAWYFFGAIDQIPEGWPDKYGDCDDFCKPCLDKIVAKKSIKKLLGDKWNGPYKDHSNEGESSRNCHECGCPLPLALLRFGMESEIQHFESSKFSREKVSENDWYWLHRLCRECLDCGKYLNTYGDRVRRILVRLFLGEHHPSIEIE